MKYLLLLAIPLAFTSCRTKTPLDPNTMEPSSRCLPANASPGSISQSSK